MKKYLVLLTVIFISLSGCDIFNTNFEDLEDATGIASDKLIVSGFRKTGFLEDEH